MIFFNSAKGNMQQLFINNILTGKTLTLNVQLSNSIEDIKKKVQNKEGIPIDRQRIFKYGVLMDNRKSLSDYNVHKQTILTLVLDSQRQEEKNQKLEFCVSCRQAGKCQKICQKCLHNCEKNRNEDLIKRIEAQQQQIERLMKRNQMLEKKTTYQNQGLCKICLDKQAVFCMENCGHVSMCEDHNNLTRCPICRAKGKVIRIYASLLD